MRTPICGVDYHFTNLAYVRLILMHDGDLFPEDFSLGKMNEVGRTSLYSVRYVLSWMLWQTLC